MEAPNFLNKVVPTFVTISDTAYNEIKKVINAQTQKGLFVRLYVQSAVGGISFGMALDTRRSDDDHVCFVKDLEVAIDKISFPYLVNANIDYVSTKEKSGFQITSPNKELIEAAGSACGSCSGDAGCC